MKGLNDAVGKFREELMEQAEDIADNAFDESGELDYTTIPVLAFAIGIILGRSQNDDQFKKEGLDIVVKMIMTAMWKNKPGDFKLPELKWPLN
jgi:hypothetical protein